MTDFDELIANLITSAESAEYDMTEENLMLLETARTALMSAITAVTTERDNLADELEAANKDAEYIDGMIFELWDSVDMLPHDENCNSDGMGLCTCPRSDFNMMVFRLKTDCEQRQSRVKDVK